MRLEDAPGGRLRVGGFLGGRLKANVENWLLRAPDANPGMIGMFHVRDRKPEPNIVPWAGEFAGKYLWSAIQAMRLSDDPRLRAIVRRVVKELIDSQAEDGYLGPFPKAVRLKGNWDLWGHYHCIMALLLWYESTGDKAALASCRRAADLICHTFLGTGFRVFDAGSQEMNMAVIHVLGRLYRTTHEPRYLEMMREIEKDWERAGDYLRTGVAGVEFYKTPRPRWESLPDIQGLLELYRITGDEKYRKAFEHHWRSILQHDRRNTGAFSSGEQATGDPFAPTAIETCCTTAWIALTVDYLHLTGDPLAADELELSTLNTVCGSQNPSGRWWTYSTPMDGIREASAHAIVFQARAGTPELNCCSVNGPRGLGMLSEWAVVADDGGLVVNYYGPGEFTWKLPSGTAVKLRWETDYPLSGHVTLHVEPATSSQFVLRLRIPAWSERASVSVNRNPVQGVKAGAYLALDRTWHPGDTVTLDLDMRLRLVRGEKEAAGKVSVYRGPVLLAYDQALNSFDEDAIPVLHPSVVQGVSVPANPGGSALMSPWLTVDIAADSGRILRLCDFASAGCTGTRYRSWLSASD